YYRGVRDLWRFCRSSFDRLRTGFDKLRTNGLGAKAYPSSSTASGRAGLGWGPSISFGKSKANGFGARVGIESTHRHAMPTSLTRHFDFCPASVEAWLFDVRRRSR